MIRHAQASPLLSVLLSTVAPALGAQEGPLRLVAAKLEPHGQPVS